MDTEIRDLLVKSCREMWLASQNCSHDRVDDECCDWYHSAWQYLRAIDCVSAPQWHEPFYTDTFKEVVESKKEIKVLISGTADYSLLHIWVKLARQYLGSDKRIHVDVVDKCSTPLKICKWYMDDQVKDGVENIISIDTNRQDLFFYSDEHLVEYDIVCADAFLTRFSDSKSASIVRIWNRMLKKGGKVITTVRISDKNSAQSEREDFLEYQAKINTFLKRVTDGYRELNAELAAEEKEPLDIKERNLKYLALQYIIKMKSHPQGGIKDIQKLFSEAKFKIDETSKVNKVKGEISETNYYQVVAVKR